MAQFISSDWFKRTVYFTVAAVLLTLVPFAPIAVVGGLALLTILPGAQWARWLGLYRRRWDFEMLVLSLGLGAVISPILIYWLSLLAGFNRWLLLVCFPLYILAMAGWVSRGSPPGPPEGGVSLPEGAASLPERGVRPSDGRVKVARLERGEVSVEIETVPPPSDFFSFSRRAWIIAALLISFSALGAFLAYFQLETAAGFYPVQMEDWQKHYGVAFALRYTGIPPTSMFFYGMFPEETLVYYYFLHLNGATLDLLQGGSPSLHNTFVTVIVLASLIFSSMFLLLAQRLFRRPTVSLWSLAFVTVIGGLDTIPIIHLTIQKYRENFPDGPLPAGLFLPREHIDNWISALSLRMNTFFAYHIWVPQHLTGLMILCLGCYLYLIVKERRKLLVILPLLLLALLGHSTWIAVIVFASLFFFALIQLVTTYRRRGLAPPRTLFLSYAAIALAFGLIGLPFILSLVGPQAPKSGLAFEIPRLDGWWLLHPIQATFGPTLWARLLDLPLHFFIEMGALLIAGLSGFIIYWRSSPPQPQTPNPEPRTSIPLLPTAYSLLPLWTLLLILGTLTVSFFASGRGWAELGLIQNNDLGLRALMPGQLVLALFAGYFMGHLPHLRPVWWRRLVTGLMALLIALGVSYAGWEFIAMGLAKYWSEPQLDPATYLTLRAIPEVTTAQDKQFPVVQHRQHRNASRFQLSLAGRPVGFSTGEAVVFHPNVQDLALAHELSEQAFDNGLPVWSYQMLRHLGANYVFVGPAEREPMRHPEKYDHPQYFQPVYQQGDYEIYLVQPAPYHSGQPLAQFDQSAISFEGYFLDHDPRYPGDQSGSPLGLVTAWRLNRPVDKNYTTFIHLVDQSGSIVAQADHQLWAWDVNSEGPTTTWTPDMTHLDIVPVPEAALDAKGPLTLRLGLWLPDTGQQFPVEETTLEIDADGRLVVGALEP